MGERGLERIKPHNSLQHPCSGDRTGAEAHAVTAPHSDITLLMPLTRSMGSAASPPISESDTDNPDLKKMPKMWQCRNCSW